MLPLTKRENRSYHKQKLSYMSKYIFNSKTKIYWKNSDHDDYTGKYRGATLLICNLR